jgi:NAD(P)-dependent dehydrogenase (short-subunit alcohol dehydrogenase family)
MTGENQMDLELRGKRALVTGSSSGIGEGIARVFAQEGARLVIHGRDRAKTQAVGDRLAGLGTEVVVTIGELDREDDCTAVAQKALAAFGGIDILVNNAGGMASANRLDQKAARFNRPWLETPWDDWRWTYEQNMGAAVRLIQGLAPGMVERKWGRIINISSASGTQSEPDLADYQPAKAAMINMTTGLAKSLGGTGVTVNTVTPGTILTEGVRSGFVQWASQLGWATDDFAEIERRFTTELIPQPIKHFGRVEDIGRMVAFIASPQAAYMTGGNYRVDGGQCRSVN